MPALQKVHRTSVKVSCARGLHTRCAHQFINLLRQFKSDIRIYGNGRVVNARNIMDLLLLGTPCGAELKIEAEGEDAELAVNTIESFFRNERNFTDHE